MPSCVPTSWLARPPRFLSLGAGVQSSTLALMIEKGEVAPVRAAVFADTGAEPKGVYDWLDWLEKQLSYPVIRASKGNLGKDALRVRTSKKTGLQYLKPMIPAFYKREGQSAGLLRRDCTSDYKIDVIYRAIRDHITTAERKGTIPVLIGISTDEAHRMKPARRTWVKNEWPLIVAGMSRQDCFAWMDLHKFPTPPRSACTFCPFHSNEEWHRLKTQEPDSFAEAVAFEKRMRNSIKSIPDEKRAFRDVNDAFLHRSCQPLASVDFKPKVNETFGNECDGVCGV